MKDEEADRQPDQADQSDQLSPNRALRQSLGSSGSQRAGDSGPVANPTVSFRDEPGKQTSGEADRG